MWCVCEHSSSIQPHGSLMIHRLLPTFCSSSSIIHHPSSVIHHPQLRLALKIQSSFLYRLLSSHSESHRIYRHSYNHSSSTTHYPSSTIHHPSSVTHHPSQHFHMGRYCITDWIQSGYGLSPALILSNRSSITFSDLHLYSSRFATFLSQHFTLTDPLYQSLDLPVNRRVLILLSNCSALVFAYFGSIYEGGIVTTASPFVTTTSVDSSVNPSVNPAVNPTMASSVTLPNEAHYKRVLTSINPSVIVVSPTLAPVITSLLLRIRKSSSMTPLPAIIIAADDKMSSGVSSMYHPSSMTQNSSSSTTHHSSFTSHHPSVIIEQQQIQSLLSQNQHTSLLILSFSTIIRTIISHGSTPVPPTTSLFPYPQYPKLSLASSPSAIYLTSGTTGQPKLIVYSQTTLPTSSASHGQGYLKLSMTDRVLPLVSLSGPFGFGCGVVYPLSVGASAIVLENNSMWSDTSQSTSQSSSSYPPLVELLEYMTIVKPTILVVSPKHIMSIVNHVSQSTSQSSSSFQSRWIKALSSVRTILSAGDTLTVNTQLKWLSIFGNSPRLFDCIGSTESSFYLNNELFSSSNFLKNTATTTTNTTTTTTTNNENLDMYIGGLPSPDKEIRLVEIQGMRSDKQKNNINSSDDRRDVDEGEIGEIWVRGSSFALGYLNTSQSTSQSTPQSTLPLISLYNSQGWYETKDTGYVNEHGRIIFTGRLIDDLYSFHTGKFRGLQQSPIQVESFIRDLSCVTECCVVAIPTKSLVNTSSSIIHHPSSRNCVVCVVMNQNYVEQSIVNKKYPNPITRGKYSLSSFLSLISMSFIDQLPSSSSQSIEIFIVPSIPRSNAGKIDRRQLISWFNELQGQDENLSTTR